MENKLPEQLLLSEIQVLLSEKRTYFSILRTGMTVMTVPLSVIVFLLATNGYHKLFDVLWTGSIVILALLCVSATGLFITLQSQHKIKRLNHLIRTIERENKRIAEIVI